MTAFSRLSTMHPARRLGLAALFIIAAIVVVGRCSSGDATVQTDRVVAPTPIAAPDAVDSDGQRLALSVVDGGNTTGLVMTNAEGFAVYGVANESTSQLVCVDDCTTVWIPLAPQGDIVASELDSAQYATFERPDGTEQVSYRGIPLYTWTGDRDIGITNGAGVAGIWFALTEAGGFGER